MAVIGKDDAPRVTRCRSLTLVASPRPSLPNLTGLNLRRARSETTLEITESSLCLEAPKRSGRQICIVTKPHGPAKSLSSQEAVLAHLASMPLTVMEGRLFHRALKAKAKCSPNSRACYASQARFFEILFPAWDLRGSFLVRNLLEALVRPAFQVSVSKTNLSMRHIR